MEAVKITTEKTPDLEAALGAIRTLMHGAWITDLHGSLLRHQAAGTLPADVCRETLEWYSAREIVRQASRQMSAIERLEAALGVNVSFANGEKPDDEELAA